MSVLLDHLPTILVLLALVGTFLSLRRHAPSNRTQLWGVAWGLVLLHFLMSALESHSGFIEKCIESMDLASLELSGVVFVISLAALAEQRWPRLAMYAGLGIPPVLHCVGAVFAWPHPHLLALLLAVFFGASFAFTMLSPAGRLFRASIGLACLLAGLWSCTAQWRGDPGPGAIAILTLAFAIPGILFWRRYPRFSPGVVAVTGGFLCWGAVFPVGNILDRFAPHLTLNPELWNVPKYFVAFGMILTLLEDKSRAIEQRNAREHAENALLERFARVTSQLLGGKDPVHLSNEIVRAISEVVNFRRVAIIVARQNGTLFVAGAEGYSEEQGRALQDHIAQSSLALLNAMRAAGTPVCGNSFRFGWHVDAPPDRSIVASSAQWTSDEALVVPLVSRQGLDSGWIVLSEPTDSTSELLPRITRLELLASDLATQIENMQLQSRLVRSEKLAALGQLVAGVAHELNNPLTGIIGFSDILREEIEGEAPLRRIGKLGEEARRMKRIVDNLLHFSRQTSSAAHSSSLPIALRDVLKLREYFVRTCGIAIDTNIAPNLPPLAIGEDELKQVLLNLLNNALDAVEHSTLRRIGIAATLEDGCVTIRVEDSGPGFTDLHRAFDPFYTTKPIGKGTGLGLSICYGILKSCGGGLHVSNRDVGGASVIISVPAVQSLDSFEAEATATPAD